MMRSDERYADRLASDVREPEMYQAGGQHTSLVGAIAHELAKIHRAAPAEHWRAARRLLEDTFRLVERTAADGTSAGGRPQDRERTCRAELAHLC